MKRLLAMFAMLRVVLHLLHGLLIVALIYPHISAAARQGRTRRWSAQVLAICGVRLKVTVPTAEVHAGPALIVANHVSWLDIFVINAMQPCRFVAKSDIRDWPLIGWLCAKTGTIFIARGRNRDVRRIFKDMVASIHAGERVAVFPEGTTSMQGSLLPFHANLFEAAIDAQVPIQPYALRYTGRDGRVHAAIDYVGETTFASSLARVLAVRDFTAELIVLPVIATQGVHRRELAVVAREGIAATLESASGDN
ncbi:MAG: lysophospholipid acyltransferase family protein [Janthinobacterium lividum]